MRMTHRHFEIMERLMAGNRRRVARGNRSNDRITSGHSIAEGLPLAAVFVCSDLVAPAEQVFDVGPGQLHVVQTAANIVGAGEAADLLLAHKMERIELAVVLGHGPCEVIRRCVVDDANAFGLLSREVHETEAVIDRCRLDAKPSHPDLACMHALRMADLLLGMLCAPAPVAIVAAYLDEASGRVTVLREAAAS